MSAVKEWFHLPADFLVLEMSLRWGWSPDRRFFFFLNKYLCASVLHVMGVSLEKKKTNLKPPDS